jgi:drug/metabolite transporter (DMT)-like permease
MARKHHPRPPGTTGAAYLMVAVALFGFLRGTLLINDMYHEAPADEVVPYFFGVPIIAGFCAPFIFRGSNWARILFWVVAGPLAVTGLIVRMDQLNVIYTLVCAVAGALLATRNSHWFFTGRDYRRRPGFNPHPQRHAEHSGGERERRKFEY